MIELAWEGESTGSDEAETCAICLEPPAPPALVVACCTSPFCERCLVRWVTQRGNSCPVCRGRAVDEHTMVDDHVLVVPETATPAPRGTLPLRLRIAAGALTVSSVFAVTAGFYKFVEAITG